MDLLLQQAGHLQELLPRLEERQLDELLHLSAVDPMRADPGGSAAAAFRAKTFVPRSGEKKKKKATAGHGNGPHSDL